MSTAESLELFQTVCFITCMQHGKGLISKHPSYIEEKKKAIENPLTAWSTLDWENQLKVVLWAEKFGFPLEDCLNYIRKELS